MGFSTGGARRCLGDVMGKMRKKGDLPRKLCVVCGREFVWRKKWEREWERVRYCSERCRGERQPKTGPRSVAI